MSQLQNSSTRKIALSSPTRVRASSPTLSGRPPSTRRTGLACPTAMGFKILDFPLSLQFCNCLKFDLDSLRLNKERGDFEDGVEYLQYVFCYT